MEYRLRGVLRHGVAFHYGNMPLILRAEIERLFRAETIRYLVCTSTLLEGVNLPCRTLFARAPRRGNNRPMTSADFWNLAGRAGRWGTEFRGNIVCVDTRASGWEQVPRTRQRERLMRAADAVLGDPAMLEAFIADEKPADAARGAPLPAAVLSFLATRVQAGRPLAGIPGVNLTAEQAQRLTTAIRAALARVELPSGMYARHPGISPLAMQVLLDYFRGHPEPDTLPLELPDTPPARLSYVKALSRCRDYLGASMFGNDDRCAMLGMLVRNWMRGYPLARIIEERIRFLRDVRGDPRFDRDTTIRSTLDDVEQIARFAAPRYLGCYHEVHSFFLGQHDRRALIDTETLTMMLELGVSRPTAVSLMSVGLSRTSALALSALIENDDLTPQAVLAWLREQALDRLQVPALVRREARELIASLRDRP